MRTAPTHYLRYNDTTAVPTALFFLDCESVWDRTPAGEFHILRCWSARAVHLDLWERDHTAGQWYTGGSVVALADTIEYVCRTMPRLTLFTHNLAYDLRVSGLVAQLEARGWRTSKLVIGAHALWANLRKGGRTLKLRDSVSLLPRPIADLAPMVGLTKPPLPTADDGLSVWHDRCQADVHILSEAMCTYLSWHRRQGLGRVAATGAATGWNTYRHLQGRQRVLIDPTPERIARDRQAIYGGIAAVSRTGTLLAGPYVELDIANAYLTTAAFCPLPIRRDRDLPAGMADIARVCGQTFAAIADAVVRCDVPRYPVRVGRHVVYPTGTFPTVLAGPEIGEAYRRGELVSVGKTSGVILTSVHQRWARAMLDYLAADDADVPPAARVAVKQWGRSVIGKWAAHGYESVRLSDGPLLGWNVEPVVDHASGRPGSIASYGGSRVMSLESDGGDNSFPAVTAFVESYVRRLLNEIMDLIGRGAVMQCNTDGIIVAQRMIGTPAAGGMLDIPTKLRGRARLIYALDAINERIGFYTLRVKRSYPDAIIYSTNIMRLGAIRRMSGIPTTATETTPDVFESYLWPGMGWQVQHGAPGTYVRPRVIQSVAATVPAAWAYRDGRVTPYQAAGELGGPARILPWEPPAGSGLGWRALSPVQHPLSGLTPQMLAAYADVAQRGQDGPYAAPSAG